MRRTLWIVAFIVLAVAFGVAAFDTIPSTDLDERLPNGLEGMLAIVSLWFADLGA